MALDPDLITQVMYDSIRMKAEVVAEDEREAGVRSTLNWGHTIGHAIEALKSPAMMHGECVAVGCVVEGELTRRLGNEKMTKHKIQRIQKCFESYGLPVHLPKGLDISMLMKKMEMDKKNRGKSIRCTIVTDIGVSLANPQPIDKDLIKEVMSESMSDGLAHPEWAPLEGKVPVAKAGGQMGI